MIHGIEVLCIGEFLQVPVYKEPTVMIPGTPAIVQHEILNNRRHVLTKVIVIPCS